MKATHVTHLEGWDINDHIVLVPGEDGDNGWPTRPHVIPAV